jgi:hypothetical protein
MKGIQTMDQFELEPIPDKEVALEWLKAQQKHGNTIALHHARRILPVLLSLKPETVEAFMRERS